MKRKTKADLREMQRRAYRAAKREWLAVPIDKRPQRWTAFRTVAECFRAVRWIFRCRKGQQAAYRAWKAAGWLPERVPKEYGGRRNG